MVIVGKKLNYISDHNYSPKASGITRKWQTQFQQFFFGVCVCDLTVRIGITLKDS